MHLRRKILSGACLALLLASIDGCRHHGVPGVPATDHATSDTLETTLHSDVDAAKLNTLHWPDFSDYKPLVQIFYDQREWNPAWVDNHKPTSQAIALTKLFAASDTKGLDPEDYDASLWPRRLASLPKASDTDMANFDVAMTVAAMRYISDLHIGRVNPEHFAFGVSVQDKKYDLPNFLTQQVVAAGNVSDALQEIEPDSPEYRATLQAFNHYQDLAKQAGQEQPLPPAKSGKHYTDALVARLRLLGDLPDADPASSDATTSDAPSTQGPGPAALTAAIKHFQMRHGLANDGKLTPDTIAALNVPLAARAQQLADTLERWRWLSPQYAKAPIIVNIPEFVLRTYGDDDKEQFEMRVVVGRSLEEDHKTPVLTQLMKYVVMRPYWNVTPNIVRKEMLAKIAANKHYLEDKNFEVVDHSGKLVVNWTPKQLGSGVLMVREKPGPQNSLGLIKFMFPNKFDVYLHSTPATQLFSRSRRDFSHGCVRVEDPEKLADWLLRDQPKWNPQTIHDAMQNGPDNKTVLLKDPVPVLIFYETARVAEDGTVFFFNDIYGYDKAMEAVLAKGDPFPTKPEVKKQSSDTV